MRTIREADVRTRWKLVDALLHAERRWGQTYHQVAEQTGYSVEYLRQLVWVGAATVSVRTDDSALYALSPNRHELVAAAGVSDDDKRILLRTMLDRGLNHAQSRALVKDYRTLAACEDEQVRGVIEAAEGDAGKGLTEEQMRQLRYDLELAKLPADQRERAMAEARAIVGHGKDLLADLRHVVKRRLKECPVQPAIDGLPEPEAAVETQFVGGAFGAVGDAVAEAIAGEIAAAQEAEEQAGRAVLSPVARLVAACVALREALAGWQDNESVRLRGTRRPVVEEWLAALEAVEADS